MSYLCLKRDAIAVHSFVRVILPKIKTAVPNSKKYSSLVTVDQDTTNIDLILPIFRCLNLIMVFLQSGIFGPHAMGKMHVMGLVGQ